MKFTKKFFWAFLLTLFSLGLWHAAEGRVSNPGLANGGSGTFSTVAATDLTFTNATSTGNLSLGRLKFDATNAVSAGNYEIVRDTDAANQLHFNVPTGKGFEFSINDISLMTLSSAGLNITQTFTDEFLGGATLSFTATANPAALGLAPVYGMFGGADNSGATNDMSEPIVGGYFQSRAQTAGRSVALGYGSYSEGFMVDGTAGTLAGSVSRIYMLGGTLTTGIGNWVKAFANDGGTLTTGIGLQVDPPGVGGTRWTAVFGTGNSKFEGSLAVGKTTAPISIFDVNSKFTVDTNGNTSASGTLRTFGKTTVTGTNTTVTSTVQVGLSGNSKGACQVYADADGSGLTYCYYNDGSQICSTVSCE